MEKSLYIWIEYINIYVLLNFGEDPSSIKEVMPMCPLPICPIKHVSYQPNCQKDVKYQKVKHMDYGGGLQKNKLT